MNYKERLKALGIIPKNTWEEYGIFNNVEFLKDIAFENYYPKAENIFRAFKETDHSKVKVVIVGQDPYHDGSANGLCFSVNKNKKVSPSLRNILAELKEDIGEIQLEQEAWLDNLPSQGVLMLNTALTVRRGEAGSHIELWREFTEEVIKALNDKDNIVWVLWGSNAQGIKKYITNTTHHIIEGGHPSPLNRLNNFKGGKYFSKVNELLEDKIKWNEIQEQTEG